MKKGLIISRKVTEKTHSHFQVEGFEKSGEKIIILDDFIETGETIGNIYDNLLTYVSLPKIVGIFLYTSKGWSGQSLDYENNKLPIFRIGR